MKPTAAKKSRKSDRAAGAPPPPPADPTEPSPLGVVPSHRRRATLVALSAGLLMWFLLWGFQDAQTVPALGFWLGPARWTVVALLAAAAAVPAVARRIVALLDRVADPSPRARRWTAVGVAVAAAFYLTLTAHLQARDLFPKTHDDQSYLLQMQMLARGRLWMPAHTLADFFDTFYVIARPVYASLYFPGASLLYVPTIWLGLPTWVLPVCCAGAIVGLVYRVVAEAADGAAGLLAALGMVSLEYFRVLSVLLTSHEPMLLLGLLTTYAWLRWRRPSVSAGSPAAPPRHSPRAARSGRRRPWAVAVGAFAGWGAITRPADAVCFALPVGLAMLLEFLRNTGSKPATPPGNSPMVQASEVPATAKPFLATGLLVVAGAAPFLAIQLAFNKGVTGNWFETPYTYYLKHDQPNTSFGFHPYDPAARPASALQQKQDYYDAFFAPYIVRHQPDQVLKWWGRVYLPMAVDTALPARPLVALLPVGLLAVPADRRRWAVAGVVPLFLLVYFFNTFFLEHYALIVAPAALLLAALGINRLAAACPARSASVRSGLTAGFAAVAVLALPEFNPLWGENHRTGDETMSAPLMRTAKVGLKEASDFRRPAVVLFTYRHGDPIVQEPVYNTDAAWPDDAQVVHAHDLGPERNREIIRYYAERQPDRVFYRWDRGELLPKEMGTARDLARSGG